MKQFIIQIESLDGLSPSLSLCVCVCVCAVRVGGWACACVGGERFSNSNRIIPSDYRILLLLKMPIPTINHHGHHAKCRPQKQHILRADEYVKKCLVCWKERLHAARAFSRNRM